MAILNIVEMGQSDAQGLPSHLLPWIAVQTLTVGATSTASATFNSATKRVRLTSDVDCWVAFGAAPTAVVEECLLLQGGTGAETFSINPTATAKLAVIEA